MTLSFMVHFIQTITVTSNARLKSPETWLFVQQFVHDNSETSNPYITDKWIPITKGQ